MTECHLNFVPYLDNFDDICFPKFEPKNAKSQIFRTQYPFVPSSHPNSKRRFMSGELIASDGTPVLNHSSSSTSSLSTAQYHVDANGNPLIDQESHFMAMAGRMPEDELYKQVGGCLKFLKKIGANLEF